MLALRYVYVLALVAWLGGMLVLGAIVAPTTFQVLQSAAPETGRALAGDVFGTTIARFHYVEYGAGALLLLSLAGMRLLGPRPAAFGVRSGVIAIMLGAALYSGVAVLGQMDGIELEAGGVISGLPASDPRRIRFDDLHRLSTNLMMLNIAGALLLAYWEARDDR